MINDKSKDPLSWNGHESINERLKINYLVGLNYKGVIEEYNRIMKEVQSSGIQSKNIRNVNV